MRRAEATPDEDPMAILLGQDGTSSPISPNKWAKQCGAERNVLDFGGTLDIFATPSSTIDEARYWCIDVVKESIERR